MTDEHHIDNLWIPATATYNYMMKDPLLDWLKYNQKHVTTHYRLDPYIFSEDNNNFTKYIMGQGKIFEQKVLKLIIKKFGSTRVKQFGNTLSSRDPNSAIVTAQAMKKGYPIIHGGVLHNPINQTFGIPDLLIRSDWLNKIVSRPIMSSSQEKIPAPKFRAHWHYRVVDIKFTCLLLRADGVHLLNSGSFPAYKSQLCIYNQALGLLQGYTPGQTYILGRRWKFTSKGDVFIDNSCFDKLGVIDYTVVDKKYIDLTERAIGWIRECRSEEAARWNIFKYPLERSELYPNMCNSHDYPWHQIKKKIADDNRELTCLWMVGPKNREFAHAMGIYQYHDARCIPGNLNIHGEKITPILEQIIEINQPTCTDLIHPRYIINNDFNWQRPDTIEFFVDFETFNGVCTSIKHLPIANTLNMIFMIGVGYIDPRSHKWIFKSFTADRITLQEEARICTNFFNFVQDLSEKYDVKNPCIFHWAPIEPNMWTELAERYDDLLDSDSWIWVDMFKIFKSEPIVIKGCVSYGLKDVASTFKQHGFIQTIWNKNSTCVDGSGAMLAAYKAHRTAIEKCISMTNIDIMDEIIKYNEVDVKVICEIVAYLRRNHMVSPSKKRKR